MLWLVDVAKIVEAKMRAEGARNFSDEEIERCLSGCVIPQKMKDWARQCRDMGMLFEESLQ